MKPTVGTASAGVQFAAQYPCRRWIYRIFTQALARICTTTPSAPLQLVDLHVILIPERIDSHERFSYPDILSRPVMKLLRLRVLALPPTRRDGEVTAGFEGRGSPMNKLLVAGGNRAGQCGIVGHHGLR